MGLDLLDITLRIERQLGVSLKGLDWSGHVERRNSPDIAVSELVDVVMRYGRCRRCLYDLRGHGGISAGGVCPECGTTFGRVDEPAVVEAVQSAVVGALDVKPDQVNLDALLIRDLGMT